MINGKDKFSDPADEVDFDNANYEDPVDDALDANPEKDDLLGVKKQDTDKSAGG